MVPEALDANALLDALGVGVFSVDRHTGELLCANEAFARIFGYDSPEGAVGGSVFGHYADPAERREAFSTKAEGSGLGLASVHAVIRKHGGHVDMVSEEGGGIGGEEVIRRLRELDPEVKALISSGSSDDTDHKKHGFLGAIAKPYNFAQVSAALRRFLPGT